MNKAPSESLFLEAVRVDDERLSLGSICLPAAAEVEGTATAEPLFLDVEGEDFSKCLSNASLIRFRSNISPALDEPPPPRSLYMFISILRKWNPQNHQLLRRCVSIGLSKWKNMWENYKICTVLCGDEARRRELGFHSISST